MEAWMWLQREDYLSFELDRSQNCVPRRIFDGLGQAGKGFKELTVI